MTKQEFAKLFKDSALAEGLKKCASAEEVQKFLKEKGIDVSIDDLNKIRGEFTALSEDQLDKVSGGSDAGDAAKEAVEAVEGFFKDVGDALTDKEAWKSLGKAETWKEAFDTSGDWFKSW